jgi:hypothetical protein
VGWRAFLSAVAIGRMTSSPAAPVTDANAEPVRLYPKVNPYLVDPVLARLKKHRTAPGWLLLAVPLMLTPVFLAAAVQSDLSHPGGIELLMQDVRVLFGAQPAHRSNYYPLLRDYLSLVTVLATSLTVPLVYLNCGFMQDLLGQLNKWDVVRSDEGSFRVVEGELRSLNQRFIKCGRYSVACLLIGLLCALGLYAMYVVGGVFGRLSGTGNAASSAIVWWASFGDANVVGAVAFLTVGTVSMYIYIKSNLLGYCMLLFFYRIRAVAWYGVDNLNEDGYHGWLALRRLMMSVYLAIFMSGVNAATLALVLDLTFAWLALPVIALFLASLPAHALTPLVLLNRIISEYKKARAAELRARFKVATARMARTSHEYKELEALAKEEMSAIRNVHPRLFRPSSVIAAFALYVVPVVSLILAWLGRQ